MKRSWHLMLMWCVMASVWPMLLMMACNAESPTAPFVTHAEPSQPTGGSTSSTVPSTPAVTPATPSIDLKIRRTDGVVINNEPTAFTACLYKGAYGSGKLLADYRIPSTSKTPLPWENETCDPVKLQLDIMPHPFTCPEQPHGLSPLAAEIFTLAGKPCPNPTPTPPICEDTEWEFVSSSISIAGEWGACERSPVNASTVQTNPCLQWKTDTYAITEKLCEKTRVRFEARRLRQSCPCPEPTPPPSTGACYYNISGQPKGPICRAMLGGNPLTRGQWGRWPSGPPSDHCRFSLPGIYSDPERKFQLTPGQSDPRCNKR